MARASFNSWWQEIGDWCAFRAGKAIPGTAVLHGPCDLRRLVRDSRSVNQLSGVLLGSIILLATLAGCVGPDLVVDRLTYEPEEPRAGQTVTVSAVVKNKGWFRAARRSKLALGVWRLFGTGDRIGADIIQGATHKVPRLSAWQSHEVTIEVLLDRPGTYWVVAFADYYDHVNESRENNNMESLEVNVLEPVPTVHEPCVGNAILPIPDGNPGSPRSKITNLNPYGLEQLPDGTEDFHHGIDFEFNYDDELIDVVAPCDGTVIDRERGDPDGDGNETVWVTIENQDGLQMMIEFHPANNEFIGDVYGTTPQQNSQVSKGGPIGQLRVVRPDPSGTEWYPIVHWIVFREDNLDTGHECPRDTLDAVAQSELDQVVDQLPDVASACTPP